MKRISIFLIEIAVIGAIIFLISNYVFQICFVKGPSMEPTFKNGQILLAKKFDLKTQRNDIVVIKKNDIMIIKRIIGLPNDRIIIKDGYIYVNDERFDNNFIEDAGNAENEIKLKQDEYFVLGDNRQESIDSRFDEIGIIKKQEILGVIL